MTLSESDDMQLNEFREPREPRKCTRHRWVSVRMPATDPFYQCSVCDKVQNAILSRRGKQSRNYGNRAELTAARKYGGVKVGQAGGPVDIRGKDFATQMKTHRRLPPQEWTKSFAAMSQDNRCPRMLLRFVQGPGLPPLDYFVFPADQFLQWFGKDEEVTTDVSPYETDRAIAFGDTKP